MDILKNQEFISNRIYQLRIGKNLSARELSLALGMSPSYINKVENGIAMPSLFVLWKICHFFEITPEDFFSNIDEENPRN